MDSGPSALTNSDNSSSLMSEGHEQSWAVNKAEKFLLLASLVTFLLFYLPFLFGGDHAYIRIHDNLDGEAVCNAIFGKFYLHPAAAQHMLLGGNEPPYLLDRLTFPLSLLNVLPNKFLVYALNDFVVRLTAMVGMFYLAYQISEDRTLALLAGLLFSLSLSLTVHELSIAGTPAVVYLIQETAVRRATSKHYLLLLLLGWNTSLGRGGIFLLILLPLLRRLYFGKANHNQLLAYGAYALGLCLGSVGLLYAAFSRIPLQRDQFAISGNGISQTVEAFVENQFSPVTWQFFHVSAPLVFVYIAILAAFVLTRDVKLGGLILLIVLVNVFYCLVHFDPIAQMRIRIGGLINTFQFDRFFFLDSFLIVSAWVVAMCSARLILRRVLIVALSIQLIWTFGLATHIHTPITRLLGRPSLPSFNEYYKRQDYSEIKGTVGDADTINVGLDPMVAVMNQIATLDGYYNVYPLAYKAKFRRIIARQLEISDQKDYFDKFGSRIYTFADTPVGLSLDYCAAYRLGARFVISRFEISSKQLTFVETTTPHHLFLYSIEPCS